MRRLRGRRWCTAPGFQVLHLRRPVARGETPIPLIAMDPRPSGRTGCAARWPFPGRTASASCQRKPRARPSVPATATPRQVRVARRGRQGRTRRTRRGTRPPRARYTLRNRFHEFRTWRCGVDSRSVLVGSGSRYGRSLPTICDANCSGSRRRTWAGWRARRRGSGRVSRGLGTAPACSQAGGREGGGCRYPRITLRERAINKESRLMRRASASPRPTTFGGWVGPAYPPASRPRPCNAAAFPA